MENKPVALVTGASSGIGAAIARRLSPQYRVFGTARKPSVSPSPEVEMLPLDVCSDESIQRCMAQVLEKAGTLDILVNNAGYLLVGGAEEATVEEAKAQFETNFFGVVRMMKAVLPIMRAKKSGHILTVSSLAGMVPVPFWAYYNASKFAVEGLLETLRYETKPFGIKVSMVEPGAIKTALYAQPQAASLPDYSPWRERAMGAMKKFENKAPGPEVVAELVAKVLSQKNPALRNTVTLEATLFPFLRWLLPAFLNEMGVRKGFNLD